MRLPAAGFYEWQVQPDGTKQPYYIQPAGDGEVFSIAACGTVQGQSRVRTCCPARSSRCLRTSCWRHSQREAADAADLAAGSRGYLADRYP